jgi:hypothetical protein
MDIKENNQRWELIKHDNGLTEWYHGNCDSFADEHNTCILCGLDVPDYANYRIIAYDNRMYFHQI